MTAGAGTKSMYVSTVIARPLGVLLRPLSPSEPEVFRLNAEPCTVGSGSQNDLVLGESTVSRQHASLEIVPEGIAVRDLGSHNGTFFMGQRFERMILRPNCEIALGAARIRIEVDTEQLYGGDATASNYFRGMIGGSNAMRRLFTTLGRLDGSLLPVLVQGESGVGKELVARAIHEGSRVSDGPFVAINCGAMAKELVASALFGHAKGAFTGAVERRRGAFGAANNGTLFLDEIGELPLELQAMLLRALEEGEVTPVGDDTPQRVRVRVVAATNRMLETEVAQGRFRQDLYYRLAVALVRVPSLSDRTEDIGLLAQTFAHQEGISELPEDTVKALAIRRYDGNVRELRNLIRSFAVFGTLPDDARAAHNGEVAMSSLVSFDRPFLEQRDAVADGFTRAYLVELLKRTGGNQSEAARIAGLDRTYLGRLLSKLGMGKT